MGNKRRRIAHSCVDCRRRKVKCDRTYPICIRCEKGGNAETCKYVKYEGDQHEEQGASEAGDEATIDREGTAATDEVENLTRSAKRAAPVEESLPFYKQLSKLQSPQDEIRLLRRRLADLEARTLPMDSPHASRQTKTNFGYPTPSSSIIPDICRNPMIEFEQMLLRGKSFKTQYFGPSHATGLLTQFTELSSFTKDIMQHFKSLDRVRKTMEGLKMDRRAHPTAQTSHEPEMLLSFIPDRETTDTLVELYLSDFETTLRILHVPTFRKNYEAFWQAPAESSSEFLVVLLLLIATTKCVTPLEPSAYGFVGRSSVRRVTAAKWIDACDSWMHVQSKKHVTLATFQIHCLLYIAKRVNCIKIKRIWTTTGYLLRLAMAAGLHREPNGMAAKISVFEQEMRRRLWATVVELDIDSSLSRGMPASISALDWDCHLPSNIDDEDFDETSEMLPPPRRLSHFTRTSFLINSQKTAPLRLELLSRINSIKSLIPYEESLQYDQKIRHILHEVPDWASQDGSVAFAHTLARLQILEFLLLVHQPHTVYPDSHSRYFYSRVASRDAAADILQSYVKLPIPNNVVLCLFRDDTLRAAMCMCHDLITTPAYSSTGQMYDKSQAIELIQKTVELLESRVMHLGQGFHSYWITSCALSLVHSTLSPLEPRDSYAQEAADRVVKLHDKIVTLQQPGEGVEGRGTVGDKFFMKATTVWTAPDAEGQPLDQLPAMYNENDFGLEVFNLADVWNLNTYLDYTY